ncbi:hypothetical protein ANN_03113 [Periplaneta americana]|uniref:Uncharacterized protein n=1 Tax=Periplaneta americana TaxID=6978 RepID=A0ABQ8TY48_PERAM|nr:hypothetical protein ANN_03113 [Periplaneta americana]
MLIKRQKKSFVIIDGNRENDDDSNDPSTSIDTVTKDEPVHCCGVMHKRFREGRMSLQDNARPGQAHRAITPAVIAEVNGHIRGNRCITVEELRRLVGISHGSVHVIATKICIIEKSACNGFHFTIEEPRLTSQLLVSRSHTEAEVHDHPTRMKISCEEKLDEVGARLEHSPHKSLQRLAQDVNISMTSAFVATKLLKLKPYRVTVVHALQPQDPVVALRARQSHEEHHDPSKLHHLVPPEDDDCNLGCELEAFPGPLTVTAPGDMDAQKECDYSSYLYCDGGDGGGVAAAAAVVVPPDALPCEMVFYDDDDDDDDEPMGTNPLRWLNGHAGGLDSIPGQIWDFFIEKKSIVTLVADKVVVGAFPRVLPFFPRLGIYIIQSPFLHFVIILRTPAGDAWRVLA